jgi:HemY protein
MLRLVLFLAFVAALASGLAWLADRPGLIVVNWEGYEAEISVFHAVVAFAFILGLTLVAWSILRHIWETPAAIGGYFNQRRQKRGLDALSTGMIAIGAGDRSAATKYAIQARRSMPNEPLTHLLRAQAAQLSDDRATARRIYESMLGSTDTEQLGLRGLFLEAEREGETEAARQFAERAMALNPHLSWPVEALFDIQCKAHDWAGALETLSVARKYGNVEKSSAERRRAVLLTAQAQDLEDKDPERALNLALDAHRHAVDLVPAAAIAGRLLAARGNTPKAARILQDTWKKSPHPDLATAYAYARLGDSPRDRLDRVKKLAQLNPHSLESAIAVANAAIEAKDYAAARQAIQPLMDSRLTQRACTLMARVEAEEHGDKGRVREWLARAVNAPRDPAWTADGVVSEHWAAVSPVTGALDAFRWRVPVESAEKTADEIVARKLEELVALGAPLEVAVDTKDVTPPDAGNGPPSKPEQVSGKPASVPAEKSVIEADVVEEKAPAKVQEVQPAAKVAVTPVPEKIAAPVHEPVKAAEPSEEEAEKAWEAHEKSKRAAAAVRPNRPARIAEPNETEAEAEKTPPAAIGAAAPKADPMEPLTHATKMASAKKEDEKKTEAAEKPDALKAKSSSGVPTTGASTPVTEPRSPEPALSAKPAPAEEAEAKAKAGKKGDTQKAARAQTSEARIFISPRAPDDPGPEGDGQGEVPGPLKPYRLHS